MTAANTFAGLALIFAIFFIGAMFGGGQELRPFTTPPIPPTNKRVQILVPEGWNAQPTVGGVAGSLWFEPHRRFPWLRQGLIRQWLGLDRGAERGVLMLVLSETTNPVHGTPPICRDGVWEAIWSSRRGPLKVGVLYRRSGRRDFDRTYEALRKSTRITD